MEDESSDWFGGFAATLGVLARMLDQPSMAREVVSGYGTTIEDFMHAGVEEYDRAPIKKAMRDG